MKFLCEKCRGKGLCGKPCKILARIKQNLPRLKENLIGKSYEIFIGHHNYPKVFSGLLASEEPNENNPEAWFKKRFDIPKILESRSKLVYGRRKSEIKDFKGRLIPIIQEIAMASKPTEIHIDFLKPPKLIFNLDSHFPLIGNPAPIKKANLQENPKVEKKVEYIINDTDVLSSTALLELYKSKIQISNIIKIFSAGLLGKKSKRELVPTRWAITAVDSCISQQNIKEIKNFSQISEFYLFNSEYLGNHYEIFLIPGEFQFEVIEAKIHGSVWNKNQEIILMQDYESVYGRTDYAKNVAGGYYSPRLAVSEYLLKIKKQASVLVLRECREEYWVPCGVGILRETVRNALSKSPEKFSSLKDAIKSAQTRIRIPIEFFTEKSQLFKNITSQKKLTSFF